MGKQLNEVTDSWRQLAPKQAELDPDPAMERKTTKSHIEVELPDGRVTTIKELMRKYDDNKDGKIGRTELGNLLTDCNEGKRPSEEEIEYFHRIADMHDGHADGSLEKNDLEYAINCWKAYLRHQSEIDEAFDKYDQDKNGVRASER